MRILLLLLQSLRCIVRNETLSERFSHSSCSRVFRSQEVLEITPVGLEILLGLARVSGVRPSATRPPTWLFHRSWFCRRNLAAALRILLQKLLLLHLFALELVPLRWSGPLREVIPASRSARIDPAAEILLLLFGHFAFHWTLHLLARLLRSCDFLAFRGGVLPRFGLFAGLNGRGNDAGIRLRFHWSLILGLLFLLAWNYLVTLYVHAGDCLVYARAAAEGDGARLVCAGRGDGAHEHWRTFLH